MGRQQMIRKMKQAGRRQARRELEIYLKKFEEHLKPKPRFIPERIWRFCQRIFIDVEK